MTRPFWEHRDEIGRRLVASPNLLLCSDFDGTLTPIVDDPAQVKLDSSVRDSLMALAASDGISVGIISGRSLSDVKSRVGIPGLIYSGNHGLEISGPNFTFVEPRAAALREPLQLLASDLESKFAGIRGAWVENKELTLSVHIRHVAEDLHDHIEQIVLLAVEKRGHLFRCSSGLMVFELRPRLEWNKASALRWIEKKLGKSDALVVYLGDDATDEEAFAAMPDEVTVRIGNRPSTAANYFFDDIADVVPFLDWLARQRASIGR